MACSKGVGSQNGWIVIRGPHDIIVLVIFAIILGVTGGLAILLDLMPFKARRFMAMPQIVSRIPANQAVLALFSRRLGAAMEREKKPPKMDSEPFP